MKSISRIATAAGGLIALALTGAGAFAADSAANYPNRPVRWVVPFTPGASNDIIARLVGQKLSEAWGQQFVILQIK